MKYREGYKYQLWEDESIQTEIFGLSIKTQFIDLDQDGKLTTKCGYAWDGPSGPTYDSKYCMRGALFHDALYQLIREGRINPRYREYADGVMKRIINEDIEKMVSRKNKWLQFPLRKWAQARADLWYHGVRVGAESAVLPENDREVLEAP
jgi:hypothetical protein